jgi:hypothetical protein
MKTLLAALAAVAIAGGTTGCVGVVHVPGAHAVKAEKRCPPGHEWSDGECHSKGKGHDPAKKRK